ncbi:MAG: hypothetical protein KIT14_19700 [bacterium]|nr:hypothetical protein [bacterium]
MTCLSERVLQDLVEGTVADPSARGHLADCVPCRRRRDALVADTALVAALLRDGPAPVLRPPARPGAAWLSLALALAGAAALLAGVLLVPDATPPRAYAEVSIGDVSQALFALDDTEWLARPVQRSSLQPLAAALRGGWPCARPDPWTDRGCE